MLEFVRLPRSVSFDTSSGHLPVFPDYLAADCMFIDWELIKRCGWGGAPLIISPRSLALRKVRLPLMWKRCHCQATRAPRVVMSAWLLATFCALCCACSAAGFYFDSYCRCRKQIEGAMEKKPQTNVANYFALPAGDVSLHLGVFVR